MILLLYLAWKSGICHKKILSKQSYFFLKFMNVVHFQQKMLLMAAQNEYTLKSKKCLLFVTEDETWPLDFSLYFPGWEKRPFPTGFYIQRNNLCLNDLFRSKSKKSKSSREIPDSYMECYPGWVHVWITITNILLIKLDEILLEVAILFNLLFARIMCSFVCVCMFMQ